MVLQFMTGLGIQTCFNVSCYIPGTQPVPASLLTHWPLVVQQHSSNRHQPRGTRYCTSIIQSIPVHHGGFGNRGDRIHD